jgi:hypothetical protein
MKRFSRFLIVAITVVSLLAREARADEGITQPTADTTWTEGTQQTLKFDWEMGCSGYIIKITRKDTGAQIFYANHGAASGNPESYTLTTPDPSGASGTSVDVTLTITYTHTMGNVTDLTQDFKIKNN